MSRSAGRSRREYGGSPAQRKVESGPSARDAGAPQQTGGTAPEPAVDIPVGHIDGMLGRKLFGWHRGCGGRPLVVSVDGAFAGLAYATVDRADVTDAGYADGPCGFELPLGVRFFDGKTHRVLAKPAGDPAQSIQADIVIDAVVEESPRPALALEGLRRAAVICWDLAHNPAGRAYVLVQVLLRLGYQVDLVGPLHPRFGTRLWQPLEEEKGFRVIAEPVGSFQELKAFSERLLGERWQVIHICKPRWPALYLGWRIAVHAPTQVILDIDDLETSFFRGSGHTPPPAEPATTFRRIQEGEIEPFDLDGTVVGHHATPLFPSRTVSNVALRNRFGGTVLRHARDETRFDPSLLNRRLIRTAMGYADDDRVVMFVGTIRRHKGVLRIADAIRSIGDRSLKLCLVGPIDDGELRDELRDGLGASLAIHNGVPFSVLPRMLAAADLVCLPQDREAVTSQYQIPAKISDALSMNVPVIVEDLPPYADLHDLPGLYIRRDEPLEDLIRTALADGGRRSRGRGPFLDEFSVAVAADRLAQLIEQTPALSLQTLDTIGTALMGRFASGQRRPIKPKALSYLKNGRDVVFLWKQNDSGLFGRRSDMIASQFVESGFARRVIQIDNSVTRNRIEELKSRRDNPLDVSDLIYSNVMARWLRAADDLDFKRVTLITDERRRELMGTALPSAAALPDAYESLFKELDLGDDAILWACPVCFDFEPLVRSWPFQRFAADLIDDQRAFGVRPQYLNRLVENYELVLSVSQLIFANCDGVADRFADLAPHPPVIVPNAAEPLDREAVRPIRLADGEGEICIGYVGNLRDRIDAALIVAVAKADPRFRIVLVGPTGGNREIESLQLLPNVTLTGVMRYQDTVRLAAGFDIAMVPHTVDSLTDSMNPLKFYLYQALGIPTVSTNVKNITDLVETTFITEDRESFVRQVAELADALEEMRVRKRAHQQAGRTERLPTWRDRMDEITRAMIARGW